MKKDKTIKPNFYEYIKNNIRFKVMYLNCKIVTSDYQILVEHEDFEKWIELYHQYKTDELFKKSKLSLIKKK